jgi:hypothetical protein
MPRHLFAGAELFSVLENHTYKPLFIPQKKNAVSNITLFYFDGYAFCNSIEH